MTLRNFFPFLVAFITAALAVIVTAWTSISIPCKYKCECPLIKDYVATHSFPWLILSCNKQQMALTEHHMQNSNNNHIHIPYASICLHMPPPCLAPNKAHTTSMELYAGDDDVVSGKITLLFILMLHTLYSNSILLRYYKIQWNANSNNNKNNNSAAFSLSARVSYYAGCWSSSNNNHKHTNYYYDLVQCESETFPTIFVFDLSQLSDALSKLWHLTAIIHLF